MTVLCLDFCPCFGEQIIDPVCIGHGRSEPCAGVTNKWIVTIAQIRAPPTEGTIRNDVTITAAHQHELLPVMDGVVGFDKIDRLVNRLTDRFT